MTTPLPPVGPGGPNFTQVPPGTPKQAWFIVPEGEAGQIVNAMSSALNTLNFNRGGGSIFRSWLQSMKDILGIAQQKQTAWTTIHATDPSAVLFLLNQGLTPYKTQGEAGAQAGKQNQAVSPGVNAGTGTAPSGSDWQHLLVRTGEFALGGILIAIGISAIIGKSKTGQQVIGAATTVASKGRVSTGGGSSNGSGPRTGTIKTVRGQRWRMDELGIWEPI